jgi:hypothetical protein
MMEHIRMGTIDPRATQKVVLEDIARSIADTGYLEPPRYPMDEEELIDFLEPDSLWFNSSKSIFSQVSDSARTSLSQLAASFRDAETDEDKYVATEGLRAGLLAHGLRSDWVNFVLKKRDRPEFKSNIKLPEGGPPQYGTPLPHNFRESACRFYSTTNGEPDGNQGSFTE